MTSPEEKTSPSATAKNAGELSSEPHHENENEQDPSGEHSSSTSSDRTAEDGSEGTTYLVVWGQLTTMDNFNVDLYTVVEPEERIYPLWELGVDPENTRLNHADELNHRDFLQEVHLHYPSDQSYAYGDQSREIRAALINALASPSRLEDLQGIVSTKDPEPVLDHFSVLFEDEIFKKTENDWIKSRLASKSDFTGADGELPEEWDESDLEDLDVIEVDGEVHDINLLPRISILSSVVSGIPACDLSLGQEIRVRLTGGEVDNLPERLQDPRRDGLSVPVDAKVVHTEDEPSLPANIDGEATHYRGVAVKFFEDIIGYGYIHLDERVQVKESTSLRSDNQASFFSRQLMILPFITILLVLILIILM